MQILDHLQHGGARLLVRGIYGRVLCAQNCSGTEERIDGYTQEAHQQHGEEEIENDSTAGFAQ